MGKIIDLAIVVPTLNEENYIGELLYSIIDQTVSPKELVIIDACSQDRTEEEVKKYMKRIPQLKFYQIPKYSISRQRNFGAKKTTASSILFLDADTVLADRDTLENYFEETKDKNLKLALAPNYPLSDHWKDKFMFQVANVGLKTLRDIYPGAVAINLYIKRSVFDLLGGFDEEVKVGEDFELIRRYAKRKVKYTVLKTAKVYTSVRRLRKEGRIRFVVKLLNSLINVHIHGYRRNPTAKDYEFGNHPPITD